MPTPMFSASSAAMISVPGRANSSSTEAEYRDGRHAANRLREARQKQERKVLQLLAVLRPDMLPLPPVLLDFRQLRQSERCCQVGHVVLETSLDDLVSAGAANEAAPRVGSHAMQGEHLGPLKQFGVAGNDHATIAGGDVFGRIEAEAANIAHQPGGLPLAGRFDGVRTIFNDAQPVPARDLKDGIHLATTATHVNHKNRFGSRRDSLFDMFRIDIEGVAAAVHQDRLGARYAQWNERSSRRSWPERCTSSPAPIPRAASAR